MVLLYTLILLALGLVRWAVASWSGWLARKYTRLAAATLKFVAQPLYKPGNSNKVDSFAMAKRNFVLGQLVTRRDRVEAKYFRWQGWTDKLTAALNAFRGWKGKKLPYSLGVLDVWLTLYLIDTMGVAEHLSVRQIIDLVVAWMRG